MINEDKYSSILGARIKAARGQQSLRDFSKKLGISHTHLDSLEKGIDPRTGKHVNVRWETLTKLSKGTGYSVQYLVGDTDNPYEGTIFRADGSKVESTGSSEAQSASPQPGEKKRPPTEEEGRLMLENALRKVGQLEASEHLTLEQFRAFIKSYKYWHNISTNSD